MTELNRRSFVGVTAAVTMSLGGCLGNVLESREILSSMSTMTDDPVVDGQPTIDDVVPAGWGTVISDPTVAREAVDWGGLTPLEGDEGPGTEFRTFEEGEQCVVVVVGVLSKGYGLQGVNHPSYEGGTLYLDVEPYRAYVPDEGDPEYHYDYTFTLWELNELPVPNGVVVDVHTSTTDAEG